MGKNRLDFHNLVRLVSTSESDPPLDSPSLGNSAVVLKLLEQAVGGGGEILHHHVAFHPVGLLSVGGSGEAGLLVPEHRVAKVVVGERQEERAGTGPRGPSFANAVEFHDGVGRVGDSRDVPVGAGGIEARLNETVVDKLLEGLSSIGRLGLLIGVGDTEEPRVVQFALLVPGVQLFLEGQDVGRESVHSQLQRGDLGLENRHLGLTVRQEGLGLIDECRLVLEHANN